MKNDLLTIGSFTVHGYGLMIAIGVIAAYMMAEYRAKKKNMDPDNVFLLVIWALVSGYIGSKLLFIITILPDVFKDPSILKNVWEGWVVYGGIIGGVIGIMIMCRVKKLDFWHLHRDSDVSDVCWRAVVTEDLQRQRLQLHFIIRHLHLIILHLYLHR